jgi:predicted NUDIX family NTP pyrophosphohydrolase
VHVWAVEEDWDAVSLRSNMFEMEWPSRSGRRKNVSGTRPRRLVPH